MIKIGSSYDVPKRVAALIATSPVSLRLLKTVPGGLKLEKQLHRQLKAHRVHHEWFRASEDVMRAVSRA